MSLLSPRLARLVSPLLARVALCSALALPVVAIVAPTPSLYAQSSATLSGTVFDPHGVALPNASVTLHQDGAKETRRTTSDAQGKYAFANLPAGKYSLQVDANGFTSSKQTEIKVAADQAVDMPVTMAMVDVYQNVTVQASETNSVAAALAPMDALLEETSARTEITQSYIANYTSPLADYGEAVEMAPGTFTLNGNGVGLGQSKTYFRGFPDGDYDIDFDNIPFYDTNTPTHHSWAFFPSQWLGGIDFDRSPGTASTIGPTPFGGSIHLLSRELSPISNIRGGVSYGSWGTLLADVQYDSGQVGKLNFAIDVHHMDTKGYQTNNFQNRNAGAIKVQYKFSPQTVLTGFSGVIWLDANTPNFSATRCQMYGPSSTNATTTCVSSATDSTLLPYTNAGIRFLNADNTDPVDYLDYKYNYYHVPTDFEYGRLHMERSHGIVIEFTPYTYNYDNSEKYTNAVPITEATTVLYNGNAASKLWYGIAVAPCSTPILNKKKTVLAEPCGVDKYNSYRKYGETGTLTQTSKYGVLRAGMWYEWARTSRHQFPSDPLNNWADQPLSNFNEFFWTNSYQPYAEYDFHVTKKLDVTAGSKFAYYTIGTKQYADDGKTIGNLGTGSSVGLGDPTAFITNGGSYYATLPSLDANYRLKNNWSVYGQVATGSVVPPSSVFDYAQTSSTTANAGAPFLPVETLPKQQRSTTYQGGTVLKLKRVTFDADFYHIRFDNSYSSVPDPTNGGEPAFYVQPASITKGFEAESNVYLGHGVSAYLNATVGRATYTGSLALTCITGSGCSATTPQYIENTPSGQWVQQTPSDTEAEGISYQNKGWDAGLFNKRVGTFYIDNGSYHNQATIDPFSVTNTYLNYTVRGDTRFNQTKIRLSVNNLFNLHSITGDSIAGSVANQFISANNTTYTDAFNTNGQTLINGADAISILAGRSIVLSVTFGFNPKH